MQDSNILKLASIVLASISLVSFKPAGAQIVSAESPLYVFGNVGFGAYTPTYNVSNPTYAIDEKFDNQANLYGQAGIGYKLTEVLAVEGRSNGFMRTDTETVGSVEETLKQHSVSLMSGVRLDMSLAPDMNLYANAGVGVAQNSYDYKRTGGGDTEYLKNGTGYSYAAGVGVGYQITENTVVTAEGSYTNFGELALEGSTKISYQGFAGSVGVKYSF